MWNPFAMPLDYNGGDPPTGYGYDLPSDVTLDDPTYPDLTGLGGGVAAYRGNQDAQFQNANPEYAGEYGLDYLDAPGLIPAYAGLNPAPGSVDLIQPRNAGEVSGTNRIIHSVGPVTGESHSWTELQTPLNQPNPNYGGPVTGGGDYSQQLAATYFASQARMLSEQASAQAMVYAV